MRTWTPVFVAGFTAVSLAPAAADTIIETTYQAVIDATRSSVTYEPGGFVFEPAGGAFTFDPSGTAEADVTGSTEVAPASSPPGQVRSALAGTFDVLVSEYRWDAFGGTSEFWVRFDNPVVTYTLDGIDLVFDIPRFFARLDPAGGGLSGDTLACTLPLPPGTSCTGLNVGIPSQYTGTLAGDSLSVDGRVGAALVFDPYLTYTIVATVTPAFAQPPAVPVPPAATTLLLGVIAVAGLARGSRDRGQG